MHEIEVKATLKDEAAALAALEKLGCVLGAPVTQDDTVYVREVGSFDIFMANHDFLRIRVQNDGRILFTVKHHPERAAQAHTAPLEYETEIGSRDVMHNMLTIMGFKDAVRIKKTRRKAVYGKWEVCVDDVEGLGAFIELEELGKEEDAPRVQEEMRTFLQSLGVSVDDVSHFRYDALLLRKEYGM